MEATWAYYGPVSCGTRTMIGTDVQRSSRDSRREKTPPRRAATSLNGAARTRSCSRTEDYGESAGPAEKIDSLDYVRADFISCF